MYVHVKPSIKQRVLSFFMAFAIIFVSLPYVGWRGTEVDAAALTGDGNSIDSNTKTTTIKQNNTASSDTRFTYTGKITKAQATLFDYVSDYELINNSYNNILHTEGGYDDAYTAFNDAISQSNNAVSATPLHAYSDNITITLETSSFSDRVFIYLFKSTDNSNNGWPGKQMTYDSASNRYTYTFSRSSTNTSSPYWLGFTPDRIIFTDGTDNANTVKSRTISQDMAKGNTYSFVETNLKSNNIIYQYEDPAGQSNLHIHYWLDDDHHSIWNGPEFPWVSSTNTYLIEVDTSTLGYVPTNFLFNKGSAWQTSDLPYNGKKTRKGFTYYCKWDNSALAIDEYLNSTFSLSDSLQQSQPIYGTKYTNPLYFGCFWRSNSADPVYVTENGVTKVDKNNVGYSASNKAVYNNFWWQANMGLKNTGTTVNDDPSEKDTTGFRVRGTASTQGLVHDSLSVNDNLVDVNGTTELPYFDKASSLVTDGLMKYYDKDETGDNIHFPFYEVRSDAATNVGSGTNQLAGTYQAYTGTGAVTQYAKFYQFDSKESNVRFEIKDDDPSLHKGHFVETSQAITHGSTAGYFPFNDYNKKNENQHNLGVGTKFEMTFKLQPDGCVGVVDSSGNDLDTNDYKTRVHTIFEFEGDDDLWVFIDGKLVLDMGGAHFKSHGVIDFAARTATVEKAITIGKHRTSGYTGNDKDDLGVDYTSNAQISNTAPSTDYFKNRLKSGSFRTVTLEGGGTREEYDPNVSHKITVFYMERGMLDSNLLIRFNYSPESNFSKMKITEVTDYSAINTGLQPFFQEAAENDVFMYTVENKGTVKADVLTNSAAYPTNENRTRKNEGEDTVREKLAVYDSNASPEPVLYTSPGHVDPNDSTKWIDDTGKWSNVSGTSYLWVDGFTYNDSDASASKLVGKTSGTGDPNGTNTGGELFLMYGTCNNLYPPAGTEKEGKESSAEFEKTFTRDSIMKITQSNDLHKPTRTVSDGVLQVENFQTDSGRDVDQYYTTAVRLVDRDSHVNATLLDSNEDPITTLNPTLENGGMFKFNNASSVDATSSVMLTEYFVNTPKKGAITVKKELDSTQHDNADSVGEFTFRLYLTDVFDITGVNVVNSTANNKGYDKIAVTRLDKDGISSTYSSYSMTATDGESYGEFKLKAGETLTINDIPYNTHYRIEEISNNYGLKTTGTRVTQYTEGDVGVGTLSSNASTVPANNALLVNTHLTGELKFKKTLGDYAAENGITGSSEFVYHVVLTAPSGTDFTNYISNSSFGSAFSNVSIGTDTCTFDVTVTAGDSPIKSLSGIPYGTKYTVTENRTGNASNVTSVSGEVTNVTLDKNNAAPTVDITNNYPAPRNTLKIKEVTDFKDVNEGLLALTEQAADGDVFQYTIKNKGTVNGDVLGSDIQTPTYDYYTRTNDDADTTQTTKLTGQNFIEDDINDLESIFLDTKMDDNTYWDKDSAIIAATFQNGEGGYNTNFILGTETSTGSHIYRFNGFAANGTAVRFFRLNPTYSVSSNWPSDVWNQTKTFTYKKGVCYRIVKINGESDGKSSRTVKQDPYVVDKIIHYETNNFTPGDTNNGDPKPVANTNYIWKEAYANKVAGNNGQADDTIDGMTNTTDANGNFWLMYGTKYVENVTTEKESSAEFIKQFKVDNDNPSVMTVTQNGTLSAPSHPTTSPAEFAAGSRNVSTYYDTDVTATDTAGNDITFTNSGGNTVFDYKNAAGTTASAVRITETFTNTVNVGAITVQKKILKPGSDPAEYLDEDTATFTFRVQLKKVFGVSGLNVGTTNSPYTGVSATKIKKDGNTDTDFTGLTEINDSGEKYGQFTLKNGEKLTISGIPVGTEYKITETATSDSNYQQNSTTMSDFETVTKGTLTSGRSSVEGNNETIVNVRQTGTLKLAKSLGDFAAINGKTVETPFKFNVTLTVPEGVDLTDYISDLTGFDDYDHRNDTRIYSFSKTVYDNGSTVDISGIPYGTTYTVEEDSASRAGTSDVTVTDSSTTPGTIDENNSTVNITNDYPVRTLTLLKVDPSKDNALITTDAAEFKLLKLPESFDPNSAADRLALSGVVADARFGNALAGGYEYVGGSSKTFRTSGGKLIISQASGTDSAPNYYGVEFTADRYYFFCETAQPLGYQISNTVTTDKIFKFESDEYTKFVAYPNLPNSTGVDVKKVDAGDNTKSLSGAEFELWYRDTRNPSTYSINSPVISPNLTSTKSLTSSTAPEPTAISNSETIEITNYDYNAVSAPSASESQWILPRSDNDYIYFRDYNTGSSQFSEDSNGSWISYSLGNNDYGQSSELIYDTSKWLKAKFTATGKPSVEYAVWERFVDKYDGKDTVVWKIQPPDGYTNVEFILCQGNNHIRNTESFKYVLGNIYTKTNKGKYDGGKYGYPVKGEHWSTNWNGTGETNSDNRMTYPNDYDVNGVSASSVNTTKYVFSGATSTSGQTAPKQTERYVPTPQKIVFHCNSNKVWHNIHIEFFSDSSGTTHVGQGFPGYMMEPYAYAGSDYRINGYLTYELTIPDGATHFRINDGVKIDQTYGYYTKITSLGDLTDNKNKYFKIKSNNDSQKDITLIPSTSFATNAGKTFTDNNAIESDGDYVYFAAPSSWGNVYAYFYGGGNLREDNWQRACYSIWPGVAPVGSKFDDGTDHDSTIYIYSATANPDTTFEIKKGSETYRVYKFRVPLGETKNYSKVIFNNGLSHSGGSKETSAISYQAGYIYYPNGSSQKQYDNKPTYTYTDRGDNLYVRMTSTDLEKWDDLHVTFYNSSGTPILQSSSGYVMKYSGTDGTYTYFTIPIPANASKFSINNGNNKSSPHNVSDSSKYDILPYNKDATQEDINTAHGTFTKGGMLYTLSGNTLTTPATAPTFTDSGSTQTTTSSTPYPSPRGDYIYIKDADGTGFSGTPTFTFYNGDTPIDTSGLNLKVNTHAVEGSTKWYSVGIPTNATKFTINNGSTKYDIYPRSSGSDGEYTPGGMYYNATSSTELSLLWPTFTSSGVDTIYHEDDWDTDARGDTLYLVYDTIPTGGIVSVTFKNSSGSIIKKGTEDSIKATYIGQLTSETPEVAGVSTSESNAVGHWFKVNIPNNAATFTATANSQSVTDEIYKLRRTPARYHKDYTLDGMQYHIKDTTATRFYPVFTEDTVYTQQVGDQTLDTTSGVILVDETQILSAYYNSVVGPSYTAITSTNASDGDGYVLHATSSDTITYTWQEGTGGSSDYIYFDNSLTGWSTVYVYFYKDGNDTTYNSGWTNETNKMASPGSGETYYKFDVTSLGDALSNYDRVIFHTKVGDSDYSTYQTNNATYTVGSLYTPNINSSNNNRIYLHNNGYNGGYPNHDNSNIRGYFTSDNWSSNWNGNGNSGWGNQGDRTWSLSDIGTSNTKAKFQIDGESETNEVNLVNGGKGQVFKLNSYTSVEFEGYLTSSNTVENKISLTVTTPTTTTVYSSQFQPEDRYGYISDVTSMNDSDGKHNNFVKVVDEYNDGGTTKHYLTDPHILFYSDNGITEINTAVSGTTQNSHGIKLNPDVVSNTYPNIDGTQYTAYGSGTAADPYLVRLPKGAKYAKIFDGDTQVGDIVSLTDTYGKTGGVTLNVTSDSSVLSVSAESALRGGTAIQNGKKKTDYDYVYFTDTGSTTLGGNIHAYYFGDTDGEFAAWPGVAPSYSYTDNSGNTVYAFLYPTLENSSAKAYPYVMFNSGAAYGSGTITEAYPYANGVNYKIDTSATPDLTYGTSSSSVKHLTTAQAAKATETVNFTTSNTNGKYLFFINNGPKNLATANLEGTHTPLDDVHITFYSDEAGTTAVGNGNAGYVMDNTGETYSGTGTGGTVYRIAIPDGARYFSINNGTGKGTDTQVHDRRSVVTKISQNGLYKFVDSATVIGKDGNTNITPSEVKDYWNSTDVPVDSNALNSHEYYLELVNKRSINEEEEDIPETETYEVHLATVVTGSDGQIEKITLLKLNDSGTEVDQTYLDHTKADIYNPDTDSPKNIKVKILKDGTYYWIETKAPNNYNIDDPNPRTFTKSTNETTGVVTLSNSGTETFEDTEKPTPTGASVLFTKTAKEQVGSYGIGEALPGAKFKLVDVNSPTTVFNFTATVEGGLNVYTKSTSGTTELVTNSSGQFKLVNIPIGDYYLEETEAPSGFNNKESDGTTNRKVYFSVGENNMTAPKAVTMSDEMVPAYIKLYEHINEKLPAWGDPTFIFKITQTGHYKNDGTSDIETISNGKTMIVALTVDDDGKLNPDNVLGGAYSNWYQESTDETEGESPQKREYQGMYHIDSEGKIRLEPGTYSITRIPVSRYEFVADTWAIDSTNPTFTANTTDAGKATGLESAVSVTVNRGETALVHYYDKVAYYDKFSHVDTKINQFYKLDGDKNNTTAKGIRVEYKPKVQTTGSEADINITNNADFKAWFINVDGTERAMNDTDKAKLVISCLPTDNNNAATTDFRFDLLAIKISSPTSYKDKVYTFTAEYKENNQTKFTTKFDLVFERTS